MKLNWNFLAGREVQEKETPVGGVWIFFWNCTLMKQESNNNKRGCDNLLAYEIFNFPLCFLESTCCLISDSLSLFVTQSINHSLFFFKIKRMCKKKSWIPTPALGSLGSGLNH